MAKFSLPEAKAEDKASISSITPGYHRVVIVQVADVGLQRAYNPENAPQRTLGVTFENAEGQQIAKTMPESNSFYSNIQKLVAAVDEIEKLQDLLGKELDIEVEGNGKYPKILMYFHVDDQMSGGDAISYRSTPIYYVAEEPQPEVLKSLHPQLRQAVASRIRIKE